jgi:hypothetical protein
VDAAAPLKTSRPGGFTRILEHCVAVGRVTDDAAATARVRLESSLGPELAGRLVGALAGAAR